MRTMLVGATVLALASGLAGQQPPVPSAAPAGRGDAASDPRLSPRRLKSHGPGLHDYPQFLADWSKLLTERGALVDGGLHFPTRAELASTDVIVMYKGDAGYMSADERRPRNVPEAGRRSRQLSRHALRRRPAVLGGDPRRRQEARRR